MAYPKSQYTFSPAARGGYLAFLGRISPEKGLDQAIEIARQTGIPLRVAAKIDRADKEYFEARIEPLLKSPGIEFIGEIAENEKSEFLGGALALLFPISWPEPFGLVMIEAMACGTPVVAFPRGSVPEIVDHGVTGFLVESVKEAVAAVREIHTINRATVRAVFERRFSVDVMAKNYERAYAEIQTNLDMPEELDGVNGKAPVAPRLATRRKRPQDFSFLRPPRETGSHIRSRSKHRHDSSRDLRERRAAILGSDGVVVAINVEAGFGRIINSLFGAPAVAIVIANHGGGCGCCQSDEADNSQSGGSELFHFHFS